MDRQIPKEVRQQARNKMLMKAGAIGAAFIVIVILGVNFMRTSVQRNDLTISECKRGTLEVSVAASGQVVPAFEEIINSPINSRIVEVYRRAGDSVEVGTPLLKLDLETAQTDLRKMQDDLEMRRLKIRQQELNNQTYLSDLNMRVKVAQMKADRMAVELRNERYLDSLGSGTTDRVRQAELAYNTQTLELEQLQQQLDNERKVKSADIDVLRLDLSMASKSLAEMQRTFDDAQLRSPRKAVLTYINKEVGAQVTAGSRVAVVSDLTHFSVRGEISDAYADRCRPGSRAMVKIGRERLDGQISEVNPHSQNGVISLVVQLDDDSNSRLRSGVKADVYVLTNVKDDVLLIQSGSYYIGPGEYEMFVFSNESTLEKRLLQLGDANYDQVEVVSGLREGEQVVVSDMKSLKKNNTIKVK